MLRRALQVGRMGQRPGLTLNIRSMFVTLDTFHKPIGSLKVERHGASDTSQSMLVTTPVSQVEMWPCATSALAALPHHSTSASARLLLLANEVGLATMGSEKRTTSSFEQAAPVVLVGFEAEGGRWCSAIGVRRALSASTLRPNPIRSSAKLFAL